MTATQAAIESQVIKEFRGTPEVFRPRLLRIVQLFRQSVADSSAEGSLRRGLHEARTGKTKPVSTLWDGIDAE